jgi:hypothetical protein
MNHQQMEVLPTKSMEPTYKGTLTKKIHSEHCCGNENWVGYAIVVLEVTDVCAVFKGYC